MVGIEISEETYTKLLGLKMKLGCETDAETIDKLCESVNQALSDGDLDLRKIIADYSKAFDNTKTFFIDQLRKQFLKKDTDAPKKGDT